MKTFRVDEHDVNESTLTYKEECLSKIENLIMEILCRVL